MVFINEIIYHTNYKKRNWKDKHKWQLESEEEVLYVLSKLLEKNNEKFFECLDFNKLEIDIKSDKLKPDYSLVDKKYKKFLYTYYIWKALKDKNHPAWITPEYVEKHMSVEKVKEVKEDNLGYEGLMFLARDDKWFCAKKLSIDNNTVIAEILQTLGSINISIINKMFDYKFNTEAIDIAKKMTKGKRKGFKTFKEILDNIDEYDKRLHPFILHEALRNLKMLPYVTPKIFNKTFPNFKIKKAKIKKRKKK